MHERLEFWGDLRESRKDLPRSAVQWAAENTESLNLGYSDKLVSLLLSGQRPWSLKAKILAPLGLMLFIPSFLAAVVIEGIGWNVGVTYDETMVLCGVGFATAFFGLWGQSSPALLIRLDSDGWHLHLFENGLVIQDGTVECSSSLDLRVEELEEFIQDENGLKIKMAGGQKLVLETPQEHDLTKTVSALNELVSKLT